jgi:cysteinyl-tRNA synthetase
MKAQDEKRKKEEERLAKMSIDPAEMFKAQTELYSAFGEDGVPTHDKAGKEIPKVTLIN